jgi:dTDP-4-dehydrorhamnose 3,5-epimerase
VFGDNRGWFTESFNAHDFAKTTGFDVGFVQDNHSFSRQWTLRGMHFQQPPHAETKVVSCIRGRVWDVALDVRPDSPTFLRWHAEELSPENGRSLLIPQGFAHGFQTLEDDTELLYYHSHPHVPGAEGGVRFDDETVAIGWPLPFTVVSDRDRSLPAAVELTRSPFAEASRR